MGHRRDCIDARTALFFSSSRPWGRGPTRSRGDVGGGGGGRSGATEREMKPDLGERRNGRPSGRS
jgi:hypothetical protein